MTEIEALHSRIFSKDDAIREAVTSEDLRRYMALDEAQKAHERERQQIFAELRQGRQEETVRTEERTLRGRDLIARGLRRP